MRLDGLLGLDDLPERAGTPRASRAEQGTDAAQFADYNFGVRTLGGISGPPPLVQCCQEPGKIDGRCRKCRHWT
jgi:hypothetical protein